VKRCKKIADTEQGISNKEICKSPVPNNPYSPMNTSDITEKLGTVFSLQLSFSITEAELEQVLAAEINRLIEEDFHKLVSILYRIDVSEPKLKQLLKDNPDKDAGLLIARMMIERQKQKIKTREEFKKNIDEDDDEEW
jgi:hypothetical protein